MSARQYEYKREQAKIARRQAEELRKLHTIANCGLDIRINYGTKYVPQHIAMRIADQFPIWADEYDTVADRLESEMAAMFASRSQQ
jgi:hypothetical protein